MAATKNNKIQVCSDCHGKLGKEARGLRCVRCWIEQVREYNPEAADALAKKYLPLQRLVQPSLWETIGEITYG